MMRLDYITSLAASLATNVSVLFLLAAGLMIVYGVRGVINLAHGEFIMLGAYCAVLGTSSGIPHLVTILFAFGGVGAFGLVVERLLIQRLHGRLLDSMLATWGLGLIITQVVTLRYGSTITGMSIPLGRIEFGSYTISIYNLVLVGAAIALFAALAVVKARTSVGLFARATASSREVAAGLGVDVSRIDKVTFAVGAGLGGAAGAGLAPFLGVSPTMGQSVIGKVFLTVLVGGIFEPLSGLALASLTLGSVDNILSTWWAPVWGQAGLLLTAVLIVRAKGVGADMGDR